MSHCSVLPDRFCINEIEFPTGDQMGNPTKVPVFCWNVSCRLPVPAVRATHRFPKPPLSDRYANSLPSGLTDGVCTWPVCLVIWTALLVFSAGLPSTGNRQILDWVFTPL